MWRVARDTEYKNFTGKGKVTSVLSMHALRV